MGPQGVSGQDAGTSVGCNEPIPVGGHAVGGVVEERRTMASSSETLHEDAGALSPEIIDYHRAIVSLMEELEAVDWYNQRVAACSDEQLKEILAHNRDEEKEHAAMVLEWVRRQDPKFAEQLEGHLFTEGKIAVELDEPGGAGEAEEAGGSGDGSLGIGSLRGEGGL
jgi:ferritin-like protein